MHSTCSDGSLSVDTLVQAVRAAQVSVFALTDHDTVAGLEEASEHAKRLGLTLIPGVEISTRFEQVELHILGYGFDPSHPVLTEQLAAQREARAGRIPALVQKLNELGVPLTVEAVYEVAGTASPGRAHVAKALVRGGFVRDTEEAFRRYLGDRAPANVRKSVPSPEEAIGWIHAAGGKAVWAHPLARPIQRPGGLDALARTLRQQGLDGLEEVHPSHDPSARARLRRTARELGLLLTGGSDFHGEATPGISLGTGRGADHVPVSVADALLS